MTKILENRNIAIEDIEAILFKMIANNVILFSEVLKITDVSSLDFKQIQMTLPNTDITFLGYGIASGENRAITAVTSALKAPFLFHNKVKGAKNILLALSSGKIEISIAEIAEINESIQEATGYCSTITVRINEDLKLDNAIAVTILATGFDIV